MISRMFNLFLASVFFVLVLVFAYKEIGRPKSISTVVDNADMVGDVSRTRIEEIIHNYILNNPETILDSLENLQKQKSKAASYKKDEYLKQNSTKLLEINEPPILGNSEATTKLIVFFDYMCSYCKKSYKVDRQLLEQDKNVQIILRPLPILGEKSLKAIKTALAVHKMAPDIFPQFHDDMMLLDSINNATIKELLEKYEIDPIMLTNEINSYHIQQSVGKNLDFAQQLGITGTPTYVIGDQLVRGLLNLDQLKQIILYNRAQTTE